MGSLRRVTGDIFGGVVGGGLIRDKLDKVVVLDGIEWFEERYA